MEYGELALDAMAEAVEKFEAVSAPGTPEYDQQVELLRGSRLFILNTMLDRYIEEDEFEDVVQTGNRILEIAPDDTFVLRTVMQGYQEQENVEETLAWGRRLLEASPDDLNTLMAVSLILSEQEPGDDAAAHWRETRDYAARASEQLDAFLAGPDSSSLSEDQKNAFIAEVNSTLGFAALQIEEFQESAGAIRKALEGAPEDANLYSMLAIAEQGNRSLEGMMSALARAVYLDHPDPNLRASLTAIYENVNGSTDGLDGYIESQGEQIDN
jgi:tetratricopeptide (TPR) repeat protein